MNPKRYPRRGFFKKAAAITAGTIGFPLLVPSSVLGRAKGVPPSEKILLGCIGVGWQGTGNMKDFLEEADCRVVAVCDVDRDHMLNAKRLVDEKYGNQDCATYSDFRELLARTDIDAVSLGLPDHWHAIPAIEAARSGKDIFGEKPFSHDFQSGRAMCDAVKRYKRIWQTGSWQRSERHFRHACELVRNGRIGKIIRGEVGLPDGHSDFGGTKGQDQIKEPPAELDYDFWVGPAPSRPYRVSQIHKNWRWNLDTGGGQLMDWVGHHVDIAHWGMDWDRTGPLEIEGTGDFPPASNAWNTPTRYHLTTIYPGGIPMIIAGGYDTIRGGTKWIGTDGWVWVNRRGMETHPAELQNEKIGPGEIHLYRTRGHGRNFLDCVRSRQETITPAETAHRSATPGHLGMIAMTLGRKIYFNPQTEEIVNDSTATGLLSRPYRSPWRL